MANLISHSRDWKWITIRFTERVSLRVSGNQSIIRLEYCELYPSILQGPCRCIRRHDFDHEFLCTGSCRRRWLEKWRVSIRLCNSWEAYKRILWSLMELLKDTHADLQGTWAGHVLQLWNATKFARFVRLWKPVQACRCARIMLHRLWDHCW